MVKPINLSESHELRDAAGHVVGYFLPVKEYETRYGPMNGAALAARDASEERCQELAAECERLRAQLSEAQEESATHRRALYALLFKDEPHYTKEELLSYVGQKPTLEELIDELEREPGTAHG